MNKTTVVYGCGGAGINITSRYLMSDNDVNFTDFKAVAFDTSRSNLNKHNFGEENTYLIPNMDGAGGKRGFGIDEIRRHIEPMLNKHQPGDLNIVVASSGGGSGSSMGPLTAGKLLNMGKDVIFILLECGHNRVHLKNTKATLETLYGVSSKSSSNLAVVVIPLDNQSVQNKRTHNIISTLSMLWSGNNEALDSQDLHHFLHHTVHSGISGKINLLTIYQNAEDVSKSIQPISIASIYKDREMEQIHPSCIYHTHGFNELNDHASDQYHFVLSEADLMPFVNSIDKAISEIESSINSVATPNLGLGNNSDDDGFVS